jgi:hypothetical protein
MAYSGYFYLPKFLTEQPSTRERKPKVASETKVTSRKLNIPEYISATSIVKAPSSSSILQSQDFSLLTLAGGHDKVCLTPSALIRRLLEH